MAVMMTMTMKVMMTTIVEFKLRTVFSTSTNNNDDYNNNDDDNNDNDEEKNSDDDDDNGSNNDDNSNFKSSTVLITFANKYVSLLCDSRVFSDYRSYYHLNEREILDKLMQILWEPIRLF